MERYKTENGIIRYYPNGVQNAARVVMEEPQKSNKKKSNKKKSK